MGFHVAAFTMHGDGDFGADPFVHGFQFGPPRVARDVHMRLFLGDDLDTTGGKRILHTADGEFVAGDLLRRIDDEIAGFELQHRVRAAGDAAERRHRFTLRAGAQDQQLRRVHVRRSIP